MESMQQTPPESKRQTLLPIAVEVKGTSFLSLPDDVYGMIYCNLRNMSDDGESIAALRHTCKTLHRSSSINAQLCTMSLSPPILEDAGQMESYITSFPKHAVVKVLSLENVTNHGLRLCLETPGIRARLATVEELTLQSTMLDHYMARILQELLPRLRHLKLDICQLSYFSGPFLSELAPISLQSLGISGLRASEHQVEAEIEAVQSFVLLQSLYLDLHKDTDVNSLACLKHLTKLHLCGQFEPINLHCLLSNIPLRHLLIERHVYLPWGVHYASRTLKVISFECLSITLPALDARNFPCLEKLEFNGVDFSDGSRLSEKKFISKFKRLVSWLSRFSCTKACQDLWFKACEDSPDEFSLNGYPGISAEQCTLLLHVLLPLRSSFTAVKDVEIGDWHFNDEGLSALGELLIGLGSCRFSSNETSIECFTTSFANKKGLVRMLHDLPCLDMLFLHVDYADQVPKDTLAALLAAQQASRHFFLSVSPPYQNADASSKMHFLLEQWEGALANMPGPRRATLSF